MGELFDHAHALSPEEIAKLPLQAKGDITALGAKGLSPQQMFEEVQTKLKEHGIVVQGKPPRKFQAQWDAVSKSPRDPFFRNGDDKPRIPLQKNATGVFAQDPIG